MPRPSRIEIPGYYHIVNRGVERRKVFHRNDDFEYFLELLTQSSELYNVTIHNYCLMDNHYHLLIELEDENYLLNLFNLNLKDIDIKQRNINIVQAYKKGYSQYKIAKVLELNQATINRIIKRTGIGIIWHLFSEI